MTHDPDSELVLACQQAPVAVLEGDFRRLYDRYKDRVYNVCYRTTGNATDALPEGGKIFIELGTDGDAVKFEVRDNGEGMTEEVLAHATEPFKTLTDIGLETDARLLPVVNNVDPGVELHGDAVFNAFCR